MRGQDKKAFCWHLVTWKWFNFMQHICLFKFLLTLPSLFSSFHLLTDWALQSPKLALQNRLALSLVPVLPALICWCSPCKALAAHTAWPFLACRNHCLRCSEITAPEWPHTYLPSAFLPPSTCTTALQTAWQCGLSLSGSRRSHLHSMLSSFKLYLKQFCSPTHVAGRLKLEDEFGVPQQHCSVISSSLH